MSLLFTRTKLSMALMGIDLGQRGKEIDEAFVQIIDDWFGWLKDEESKDSFAAAFEDHRMTARVVQKADNIISGLGMNQYDLEKGVATDKVTTPDVYNTGMAGMKLRTNPANFGEEKNEAGGLKKIPGQGIKMVLPVKTGKYTLGLHDLSAVLLSTERGNILNQLAWKEGAQDAGKNAIAFMPLPHQEDLRVFAVLSAKAKKYQGQHPLIHDKVAQIRRNWTRVKLANEEDAGSGFVNVGTGWTAKERKYRYGLGLIAIVGKTGETGVAEMERRRALALEYKSMLGQMKPMPEDTSLNPTHNELVVAYRQHASKCFPLFAVYQKMSGSFTVFDGPEGFDKKWIGTKVPKTIQQNGTCK